MRSSWVGPHHMTQDACMVCNFTGHKATQCKTAKNKQNWNCWPATEPAVWPPVGGSTQNARAGWADKQGQRGTNMEVSADSQGPVRQYRSSWHH